MENMAFTSKWMWGLFTASLGLLGEEKMLLYAEMDPQTLQINIT